MSLIRMDRWNNCGEHFVLKMFVYWNFHKNVLFLKSYYVGHTSIMMIFLDHIYIIVLPKWQDMQKKWFGQRFFFGRIYCVKGHICKNLMRWKNFALRSFSKNIKKKCNLTFLNKNITSSVLKKTHNMMFLDFWYLTNLLSH